MKVSQHAARVPGLRNSKLSAHQSVGLVSSGAYKSSPIGKRKGGSENSPDKQHPVALNGGQLPLAARRGATKTS